MIARTALVHMDQASGSATIACGEAPESKLLAGAFRLRSGDVGVFPAAVRLAGDVGGLRRV
ncbi:hypothetical protein J2Z21_008746 [Streptomyces griseochromogenes]|uniref:Uncharacterized protein n=1 Tax=Streptomyces griseochromogenes TaxID=68214 RepID=A0ABS4M7T7_9ACTN|nr:hypothetical protein [Streptomyces griseochromogenes]